MSFDSERIPPHQKKTPTKQSEKKKRKKKRLHWAIKMQIQSLWIHFVHWSNGGNLHSSGASHLHCICVPRSLSNLQKGVNTGAVMERTLRRSKTKAFLDHLLAHEDRGRRAFITRLKEIWWILSKIWLWEFELF